MLLFEGLKSPLQDCLMTARLTQSVHDYWVHSPGSSLNASASVLSLTSSSQKKTFQYLIRGQTVFFPFQPGAKVHPDLLTETVRPSIDYVRHKKFRSGNFPSSLSNETDRLVHWCHGAPGVIHMLIMAHKVRLGSMLCFRAV